MLKRSALSLLATLLAAIGLSLSAPLAAASAADGFKARSDTAVEVVATTKELGIGQQVSVVVTFVNESTADGGPFSVHNASLNISFPATFTLESMSSINFGTCSSSTGSIGCSFLSFPANTRADLTLVFETTETGSFDLTATVSHSAVDPVSTNNTATCTFIVTPPTGSISGMKFHDLNADMVKDALDPALGGWTISLSGTASGSQVTASDGTYGFTGLADGTYVVAEVLQPLWTQSFPASSTYSVEIVNGAAITGRDFGNWTLGTISGLKFEDRNGDGIRQEGEPGVSDWPILISEVTSEGVVLPNPTTLMTGSDGAYALLTSPGFYQIAEGTRTGWVQSAPANDGVYLELLESQGAIVGRDFGNFRPGGLCGGKYHNFDGDSFLDANEKANGPVEGWTMTLHDSEGLQIGTTQTAADGTYCFSDLHPGSYEVREEARAGWVMSNPSTGVISVTISSGETISDQDFANYPTGAIEIFKFRDVNANGTDEALDIAVPNILFQATLINANGLTTQIKLAGTDSGGIARFSPVPEGSWRLVEVTPFGDNGGGVSTNNMPGTVVVTRGDTTRIVVGNYLNGTISGTKWHDADRNQAQNGQEPGLAGFTIELFKDGESVGTTTTDSNGGYIFSGLKPGDYVVGEQFDAPWEQVFPFEATGSATHSVTVRSGENVESINFGNAGPDADLSVVKTAPAVVTKGQLLDFTVTVTNVGQLPLDNVAMQDVVDTANFEIIGISGEGVCTNTSGTVNCTYGGLAVGASKETVIRVRAIGIGNEMNTATASTTSPDLNSENNSSTIEVLIEFADIAVQKAVSEAVIATDSTTVFTITVTNTRSGTANGVTMQDVVPIELEIVSVLSAPPVTCTIAGQTIDCGYGDLAGGESHTVTVTARAIANGNVTNRATGATTSEEANTTNNFSDVDVQIGGLELRVSFTEDICRTAPDGVSDGVSDGNVVTVTITVVNPGPDPEGYSLEITSDTSIPGTSGLGGTVPGQSSNVHTFTWQTEGLAWKSPNIARLFYNFLFKLKQGEETVDDVATAIKMLPKPLILAHGLWSNAATWNNYPMFATTAHANWANRVVAVEGMSTGVIPDIFLDPKTIGSSESIDDNAEVLDKAIEAEREKSKSCQVDVVGHSMGGLITRAYVHSIMRIDPIRISHAIQLGTPNEGAFCAEIAFRATLALRINLFRPADLLLAPFPLNLYELSPPWVVGVFNKTRTSQKDVPFWVVAGTVERLNDQLGPLAACTIGVPNDGLVEQPSAWSTTSRVPSFTGRRTAVVNHIDQPPSSQLFFTFVLPIVSGGTVTGDSGKSLDSGSQMIVRDLVAEGTRIFTSGSSTASFKVDASSAMEAVMFMGSATNAILRDPSGLVMVSSDTLSSRTGAFVTLTVPQPVEGEWTLEFSAPAPDSAQVGFSVYELDSQRSMHVTAVAVAGLVQIRATLDGAWTDPVVEATIYSPDSVAVVQLSMTAPAEYSGAYKPNVPGGYTVLAKAVGAEAMRSDMAQLAIDQFAIDLDVREPEELPDSFGLGTGYPNPAGDRISFPLELVNPEAVRLTVVDVAGRVVMTLPPQSLGRGQHIVEFDVSNLANGMYVLKGFLGGAHVARQFVVIR